VGGPPEVSAKGWGVPLIFFLIFFSALFGHKNNRNIQKSLKHVVFPNIILQYRNLLIIWPAEKR
jgi:hypothetical protein